MSYTSMVAQRYQPILLALKNRNTQYLCCSIDFTLLSLKENDSDLGNDSFKLN